MRGFLKKSLLYLIILISILISANLTNSMVSKAGTDKKPPTRPTYLNVASITSSSVSLTWTASKDNVDVKLYNIYKNGILLASSTVNKYTVSGLSSATSYNFYVKAKDAAGNLSLSSNTVTITTEKAVVTPTPTPTMAPTPAPTPTPTVTPTPTPVITPVPVQSTNKVVGYYAAWSAYSGFTPDKIDPRKLTHINYAFANIGSDLKIALGYPDIDLANFEKLKALKQINPNLKTIIAVGGWSWSSRFSDVALTSESRATFADSCVDFIVKYGFDGVDIDWEYPVSGGLSTNVNRTEDKVNFTLLMQTLREKLDARGLIDGKHYILSYAGACSSSYLNNTEPVNLRNYVDYVNVMTYDIHGMWDSYTDFNAPLFDNSDVTLQFKWSVDAGMNAWLKAGFPAEKLVMGVPFYGYIYKMTANNNNGLYQTYSGSASISYANIAGNYLNNPAFTRYFHTESKVPWLFDGSTFISYEDEQSITLKAEYAKMKGFGGTMIWELSQDPNGILLNSLYNNMQ